ncbi:MAG TPA: polyphosphate polymerase domain-containing protein [Flavobacteriales bacterium]|nr:polyphosphate polymerase domain-containing protein [Flavobacteriales bacterium]HIA10746.1 polyphosphate polymerase domain-containing protein [Flavobacteriales bacterium]
MSFAEIISREFSPITLEEMDSVKLLSRMDTKFVFTSSLLSAVLKELSQSYSVLEINGKKLSQYNSLYFDTEKLKLYTQHHNGKMNRHKVRYRKYVDTELCYLEVKYKSNKGRTVKKRTKRSDIRPDFSARSIEFLVKYFPLPAEELGAKLANEFKRITLVSLTTKERVTIDLDLKFELNDQKVSVSELIIAEVKQEKYNVRSSFIQTMKKFRIRPMRISKYCIGTVLMNSDVKNNLFKEDIKYNRFKPKIITINKLRYAVGA